MYSTLACPRHTCRHHLRTHNASCLRRVSGARLTFAWLPVRNQSPWHSMATSTTALRCKVPLAPLKERLSFNLNDCRLVSAQQHARPCRDNKRDTRQMLTASLVPSEDGLDASFCIDMCGSFFHMRLCPAVYGSLALCSFALPLMSTKVNLLQRSRDPVEKPANYQRLSEHHALDCQTHKDKNQTSMSPVAWDAH